MPPAAGDDQHKVISARKVEERLEGLNGPALLGYGQRQHPGGSAESHGRASHHLPSLGSDIDGAPVLIGKIEIDASGTLGGADVDYPFGAVELRPRFEQVEH